MTVARATTRRTKLEKRRQDVLALIVEGKTDAEIARLVGCARTSVYKFQERHAEEIARQRAELEARTADVALGAMEARIRELDWLYWQAKAEAEANGVTVVEERHEYSRGEEVALVVTRDFRSGMVREMRGLLHDIAEQKDQLPKGSKADLTVNIDNRRLTVYHNGASE